MSLFIFFRNPSPNKHIFVRKKGCAYYGKSAYYECAYYEWAQYFIILPEIKIIRRDIMMNCDMKVRRV